MINYTVKKYWRCFIKGYAQDEPNAVLYDVSITYSLKVRNFGLVWSLMGCVVEKGQSGELVVVTVEGGGFEMLSYIAILPLLMLFFCTAVYINVPPL